MEAITSIFNRRKSPLGRRGAKMRRSVSESAINRASSPDGIRTRTGTGTLFVNKNNIPSSPGSPRAATLFVNKKHSAPKRIRLPKVSDCMVMDFEYAPFQFYSRQVETPWTTSIKYAVYILCICLFIPAVFVGIGLGVYRRKIKMKFRKIVRGKATLFFSMLVSLALIKDVIVVTISLQAMYASSLSTYEMVYSPLMYIWCLLTFVFPLLISWFAGVRYVFGIAINNDNNVKPKKQTPLREITTIREYETKKLAYQEKYFQNKREYLSSVKCVFTEILLLIDATPRWLWMTAAVMSAVICLVHSCISIIYDHVTYGDFHYVDVSKSNINVTITRHEVSRVLTAMSALNCSVTSFIVAIYFTYVICWEVTTLQEWKRFNAAERGDEHKTLINNGATGIAMWWKIFQTLNFFSSSSFCVSVLTGKLACIVSMIIIMCQSVSLMCPIHDPKHSEFWKRADILILIDNILLYLGLLTMASVTVLIKRQQKTAKEIVQIKSVTMGYEISTMETMEADVLQVDKGISVRLQGLNGSLVILKEVTHTLHCCAESNFIYYLVMACCCISTVFIVPSTFISFQYVLTD